MTRPRKRIDRVQTHSPFTFLLENVVHDIPGCYAAAFVDQEGEAVDVAGLGEEFDVKVAGAHLRIVLAELAETRQKGPGFLISADRKSFLVRAMPEGYALVLVLAPRASFHVSERALGRCVTALAREAGFEMPEPPTWVPVEVEPRGKRNLRPERLRARPAIYGGYSAPAKWQSLHVLGSLVGLNRGERGYRVRLEGGLELTLVREPLGRWWSDEAPP